MRHPLVIVVGLLLATTPNLDCTSNRGELRPVPLTEPLKGYVMLADREAGKVIDEWNNSKEAADFASSWREPQRVLKFQDYQRSVGMGCLQDYAPWPNKASWRPVLHVKYELTHQMRIMGHPNHFSIWIYMDTLESRVIGGE
jgi:hypothetical protein